MIAALAGVSGMWCCRRRSEKDDDATQIRGLENLGNTCYFNSTVQALAHTNSVFREELENLHKKGEFVLSVLEFFNAMQLENSIPYSPDNLHNMFGKKSPKFDDYRQHDSHECLRNFLENVRKEERDNSGAVDKRKVLTVVDSVFGGHFMTVYICKECETPYHVCEALLDISLPIMIDEKDLAAMNSARGSNQKESRTLKLQTPMSQSKHDASQTDDLTKRKLNKSPIDIKSTAVEDAIEFKASETEQYSKLNVALQQNTSDQTFQFKPKTETTDRHSTNSNAHCQPLTSVYEVDVGATSNEPEALSMQEEDSLETEKLSILNNMINVSPTNVEFENTSGGKTVDIFKENVFTIPRMFDPDTESETFSLDDKDKDAEESKTTFGTESDLGEVCQAKEPDASEVDNTISDEGTEFGNVSYLDKLDENVENSCSSTKAEGHLAEKNDTPNNQNPFERSIPVGTEDNKESEDHEWTKSDARDNPTEIQELNEGQVQSSEEQQHKEREEHYDGQQHSHSTTLVQEQCNTGEKEGGQHYHRTELVQEQHNTGEKGAEEQPDGQHFRNADPKEVGEEIKVEQVEYVQKDGVQEQQQAVEDEERKAHERLQEQEQNEQDVEQAHQKDDTENDDKEDEDENDEQKQDQKLEEQHDAKHLLNDQPERQNKGSEEQQGGQHVSNAKLEGEVGDEQPEQEVEEQKQLEAHEDDEEDEEQQEQEHVTGHQEQGKENSTRKDDSKDGDEENKDDDEKDGEAEVNIVEEKAELEGREKQEQVLDQGPEKGNDAEKVEDKEKTDEKDVEEKHKEKDEEEKVVEKKKEVDEEQNLQQKQELGESDFEVGKYASETSDLYRETVDKLMTALSFSSPNQETAIWKHVTVDNCLMYFTQEEHIHKEYLCNPCYAKHLANGGEDVLLTSATKQTMIFNPPAILTLHLKRFELKPGGSVKRTDKITYGELLDIAPYCSSMCLRNDPPCPNIWYSLYGVVVHHGSTLKSGHYVAYVKIKDNNAGLQKFLQEKYFDRDLTREQLIEMVQEKQPGETLIQPGETPQQPGGTWYCMNDSRFHKVQVALVLNQEAYLLFYERMS